MIVDEEMLKRIDDFRFENRYPSRSAATLELIRLGMDALEKQPLQAEKAQKKKSSDHGQMETAVGAIYLLSAFFTARISLRTCLPLNSTPRAMR